MADKRKDSKEQKKCYLCRLCSKSFNHAGNKSVKMHLKKLKLRFCLPKKLRFCLPKKAISGYVHLQEIFTTNVEISSDLTMDIIGYEAIN